MRSTRAFTLLTSAVAVPSVTFSSTMPLPYTAYDFFSLPFFVPVGTAEIEVSHRCADAPSSTNILDFGLADCTATTFNNGATIGWGGGNAENAIVGAHATSRSFMLPAGGALQTGCNYSVVVGKARIATPPGSFEVNVTLRDEPTLAPQPQRAAYAPAPPLRVPAALTWYSGDFHVHSRESGDAFASATLDEIAAFSASAGLDFVHISDHNTVAAATFIGDAQSRHADVLILPGVEFTTYSGHAGALFTTRYVDHRIGNAGVTIQGAADAVHAQGGLLSINHLDDYTQDLNGDLRNQCVGCAWDFGGSLSARDLDAMEVAVQSWTGTGWLETPRALEYWDKLHALGFTQVTPIGGSDDHHGGQNETVVGPWREGSAIGSPTTCVLAANLSHAAIREGVALGRTMLKMNNASDPFVDIVGIVDGSGVAARVGGWLSGLPEGSTVTLAVSIWAPPARARRLRGERVAPPHFYLALVRNNEQTYKIDVPALPFAFNVSVPLPEDGVDRWRAELHDNESNQILSMTNHIFLAISPRVVT
jgi:hypothetical protein